MLEDNTYVTKKIKKYNNASTARRYGTSRQNVKRWRDRYDGSWYSLRPLSCRPHSHSRQHTDDELHLIKRTYQSYGHEGLAEVYVQCQRKGYQRTYESMCKQIRQQGWNKVTEIQQRRFPKSRWKPDIVTYPGQKVQIDIKYVSQSCIGFDSKGKRYYQITALDEYSRRRVCMIVDEKSVTHTATFLLTLEKEMGFNITTVQTDNGSEFTNEMLHTNNKSIFEQILDYKGIKYQRTRPYSPWQNGKVERSHREDSKWYEKHVFSSEEHLIKSHQRYVSRGNNIHRKQLKFMSPNEMIEAYFSNSVA